MMNAVKMGPAEETASNPEGANDSLIDPVAQHLCSASVIACDEEERTEKSMGTFSGSQALAKPQTLRVAIKVRGKILFTHIDLSDVVSVHAKGNCVWLQQRANSCLLRESISVVAERLEAHGFIRIHRSILVNACFVEEIRPLSTGEYRLRVEGGKEYTVTRTYKKNLKSLAELWIGTGASFPG